MNVDAINEAIAVAANEFILEPAETAAQKHEVFRLRYQVYCIERGFEPGASGVEVDEYDSHSRHVLLRHASDGAAIGTVRLVAPRLDRLSDTFPIQRVCEPGLLRNVPLARTGEISRFAISKERRMSCTSAVLLRLALMRGIVTMTGELELTHWCAVMERSLLRLLQYSAIHFHPVGPLVSYHGVRQPSAGSVAGVLDRIRREHFEVWNYITDAGTLYHPAAVALAA